MAAKRSSRPKGPPPLPRHSHVPRHDTIDVDSRWLIPPLPKEGRGKASDEAHKQPPPLPAVIAAKPRGKLPPPLPREDDSPDSPASKPPKRGVRTSRRPPPLRK